MSLEHYMPVYRHPVIINPITSTNTPYSFPYYGNYMVYSRPSIIKSDCECDSSETYSQCILRKRLFHCDNDYDGTSYYN